MLLTGGDNGRVRMGNLVRRMLCTPKTNSAALKTIALFELQYSANDDVFRLVESKEVEKLAPSDNISKVNIYPHGVSIGAVAWNENTVAGNWFAAGATSGLIILHEI